MMPRIVMTQIALYDSWHVISVPVLMYNNIMTLAYTSSDIVGHNCLLWPNPLLISNDRSSLDSNELDPLDTALIELSTHATYLTLQMVINLFRNKQELISGMD